MKLRKIAIIDDDAHSRNNMKFSVEDSGFEPILITGQFGNDKRRLLDDIFKHDVYGVISDHHLSPGKLASFFGAELLADLYDEKIPTILITQFFKEDANTSIRKYRQKLPAVIGRGGNHDDNLIANLLELSKRELENGPSQERKSHRALIRIENFEQLQGENLVEGIITNWNTREPIRFPIDMIPSEVRSRMSQNAVNRLIAFVNTGTVDPNEIYISDIHLAPSLEGFDEFD